MRRLPGCLLLRFLACWAPALASAQAVPGELERNLQLREQQQSELLLRQRQSLEQAQPGLTPEQFRSLQREQAEEQGQLLLLHQDQSRRFGPVLQTPPQQPGSAQSDYQGQRFSREREEQLERFETQRRPGNTNPRAPEAGD